MDEMKKIVICKHCGKPEFYGEMRWLSGRCSCRSCYKAQWQDQERNCTDGMTSMEGDRSWKNTENRRGSMNKTCKGCYAADTGGHPMSGEAHGCTLGYKTDGKGRPQEECPKPKSWKQYQREGGEK